MELTVISQELYQPTNSTFLPKKLKQACCSVFSVWQSCQHLNASIRMILVIHTYT